MRGRRVAVLAARTRLLNTSAPIFKRDDGKPWPALIVGGGPVGLYASALLSSFGVPSLLVERAPAAKAKQHPRSHYINSRSMELLRELGVEASVREQTPPLDEWRHFRYCSSLLGTQIAAQDHAGDRAWTDLCAAAATEVAHLSQPKLEAILRTEAERRATATGGQLVGGYSCATFEQRSDGVHATLRRAKDEGGGVGESEGEEVHVHASHLIACDGAHSGIRRALGLHLRGPPPLQHFKSVHFRAPDLAPVLAAEGREAMLYFCFNRGAIAVLVAHNLRQGEWVAQLPYFPGLQDADSLDRDACTAAIAACIGGGVETAGPEAAAVPFEVQSIGSWAMSAKVAQRLSLGNVHLLGDAAHQFPPAGAFGANTGLQDAHNLCWKIGSVHHGLAGAKLVGSYDRERRPVALENARLAVHNYHRGLRVANALGLPTDLPHALAKLSTTVREHVVPPPPPGGVPSPWAAIASAVGTRMLEIGRSHLIDVLGHEASHPLGQMRRARAEQVVGANAALPLLFARHELGFVYPMPGAPGARDSADAASADLGGAMGGEAAAQYEVRMEDEQYVASTQPGSRLPHHWMSTSTPSRDTPLQLSTLRLSTHDLLHDWDHQPDIADHGEGLSPSLPNARAPRLTLLVDGTAGGAWVAGAAQIDAARSFLRVVAIEEAGDAAAVDCPAAECSVSDPTGGWAAKRQVESCGALLVRPDGHVAWRCERLPPEANVERLLRTAIEGALYQAPPQ